jgi:threonine synthase
MTTIFGENIHNIAIEGNFDDCQEMVKNSFADQSFLKGTRLVAVNSINWARIMAQIVYYFHAALQLGGRRVRCRSRCRPATSATSSPVTWRATWACRSTS